MRCRNRSVVALIIGWSLVVAGGVAAALRYEFRPGDAGANPDQWPAASAVVRANDRPTLLVFLHPRCPCGRATVDLIGDLVKAHPDGIRVVALLLRPEGEPAGWERTERWDQVAAIPGAKVLTDVDGVEARLFGARTSGQTLLYDAVGTLHFAGGLTVSRGHPEPGAGAAAVAAVIERETHHAPLDAPRGPCESATFGCPLFLPNDRPTPR